MGNIEKALFRFDCCSNEDNGEIHDFFSFDWEKEFSTERKLKLKNGNEAHFIVRKFSNLTKSNKFSHVRFIKN